MSDIQKLEQIRLKSAERQKRFYDNNKQKILEKKKMEREQLKKMNEPILEVVTPKEYTLDMIVDVFKEITNINTQKKYINDIKRIFTVSGINLFKGTMEEFILIKQKIEESKYSLSTQKGSIQSLLVFMELTNFLINPKVRAKYEVLFDVYKIKTEDEHTEKQNNVDNSVMDFTKYLNLVLDKFGSKSKEYLIAKMYHEITVRDNFYNLKIINSLDEDDGKSNFLTDDCEHIILNDYKTKNVYDKKTFVLSNELQKLLLDYIDTNELKTELFPEHKKGLSQFIISMNGKINVKGGINEIRKMSVSQFLMKENLTAEERLEFAGKMCHREKTQQTYKRGIV
jgi:hypothetical protein